MKRNKVTCFTSLSLAVLLTVSSLSGSVVNVFATGTDDSVKVTTESKNGEDIVIENESENDIVISDTNKADEIVVENQDNLSETGQDSENIVIDDVKDICSSSVCLVKDEDEIVIEQGTSVAGDMVPLYVKAENTSDEEIELQLSFWTDVEDVDTIKAEALKIIATNLTFEEFKETDSVSIDLKSGDKIVESKATLVKEQEEDTITKYCISIKMPAKTVLDTEFHVSSDVAQTVTAVPCMADSYGKAVNVTWTEKKADDEIAIESETTSEAESEIVIEEENVEDSFASVYLGDNQVDTSSLNASDFASMRLVLLTEDKSVIPNEADVLSEYEDIYLLQFTSIQQTMNAYTYFKNMSLSVEPDMPVEAAGEKEDTEEIIVSKDALTVSETENPIDTLNTIMSDTSDSEEITVSQDGNVIALIDTGVGESANVIDRVSVIEEPETSTEHGDAMLQAIVSQNPDAKILSIRAMNSNGFGTISSLVAAMEYAISENVDMINLSLYARTTLSTSVLKSEIQKAVDAGIIVIGAAGNDGVDVVDYVPGSVESAYIIGAATEDGSRLETSNFGKTVDYNVVADSTSEATAKFTGYISKNGLDSVASVLNQGMIYDTGFGGEEPDVEIPDEDFSKYTPDTSKEVIVKYTFVYNDAIQKDETFDTLFSGTRHVDVIHTTAMSPALVYAVGDGTYKVKANAPLLNGYASGSYLDVLFAKGNDEAQMVTKGASLDMHSGIATLDESVFGRGKDSRGNDDFADLQMQIMVPIDRDIIRVMQNVTVVNADGSDYTIKVPIFALQDEQIPLAIEGKEEALTAKDFELYMNGENKPIYTTTWNDDEKILSVQGMLSNVVHSVKVVVKKDTEALFKTAYSVDRVPEQQCYRNLSPMFYVNIDPTSLQSGQTTTIKSNVGVNGYDKMPLAGSTIGTAHVFSAYDPNVSGGVDYDNSGKISGHIGIPTNLFGLNFKFHNASGTAMREWKAGYNAAIGFYCHHCGSSIMNHNTPLVNVNYKILDKWTVGDETRYVMIMMTDRAVYGGAKKQTLGGIIPFAVKPTEQKVTLYAQKTWDDFNNKYQTRPQRLEFQLMQSSKPKGQSSWSAWTKIDSRYATAPTWKVSFGERFIKDKDGNEYKYQMREVLPANYKLEGAEQKDFVSYVATFKNKLDREYISLSVQKTWDDFNDKYQTRPSRVGFQLQRREKTGAGGTWGDWYDYRSPSYATPSNGEWNWKITWNDELARDGQTYYQYRIKELIPENYRVDGDSDTKTFPTTGGSVTFKNILNNGYLKIIKKSDNPEMTDNNGCYDLAGAEFEIYTDAACTQKAKYDGGPIVTQKVTNSDGSVSYETRLVELVVGTYYVKETKPPKGFEIIEDGQPFNVNVTVGHRKDQPFTLSVTNRAENDPMVITINKIWNGPETPTVPSLAGTQFTVWYYDNLTKDVSGTPKKTWVLEVKQQANGVWRCSLQDKYLVKEKSDDFYRDPDTKLPVLPYGTYKIQETQHAPGYTFEGIWGNKDGSVSMSTTEPYITVVDKNTTGGVNLVGGNEYTGQNKPHDTSIKIRKVDENGRPLAGVKFTLKNSKGELVSTKTSGSDGYVTWDKLYPDIYTVTEIETVDGKNLLADDIEIHLPMRITEEDIKKYNIDRDKLSEWDKAEQCYYLFDVTYEISNSATFKAPSTGGFTDFMTFLPLIGGMAGLTGVGAVAMKKKRKREE